MEIALISIVIIILLLIYAIHKGFKANKVDWGHSVVNCIDGWMRIYSRRFQRFQHDEMKIPDTGGVLIVCNHVSGLEPLLLLTACERPLRFMIAVEEYNRPILNSLFRIVGCIPVERQGRPEIAFRAAIKALEKGEAVAIFPHGGIHTDNCGHRPIKAGVLKLAKLSRSKIIPTRVTGIRKPGHSFTPLFLRGNVRLQVFPHLPDDFVEQQDARTLLGDLLVGKIPAIEIEG